ncbi:MAG: hypothetical protein ABW148_10420 [Sedimenticola sp.]
MTITGEIIDFTSLVSHGALSITSLTAGQLDYYALWPASDYFRSNLLWYFACNQSSIDKVTALLARKKERLAIVAPYTYCSIGLGRL